MAEGSGVRLLTENPVSETTWSMFNGVNKAILYTGLNIFLANAGTWYGAVTVSFLVGSVSFFEGGGGGAACVTGGGVCAFLNKKQEEKRNTIPAGSSKKAVNRFMLIMSCKNYSHSMVAGGFELMSYTTRLIPLTLLIISLDTLARKSYGKCAQSAVMPSVEVTALSAAVYS